jgi:nucleoside-diphosphate-sugar epimerase
MRIVVGGATGNTAAAVVRLLSAAGHTLIAITRYNNKLKYNIYIYSIPLEIKSIEGNQREMLQRS